MKCNKLLFITSKCQGGDGYEEPGVELEGKKAKEDYKTRMMLFGSLGKRIVLYDVEFGGWERS